MVVKITFWHKSLGFLVNLKRVKRLMKIINWQTIYREPRATISNKKHKKYTYLLKDLVISYKKTRFGQQTSLISNGKRIYVSDCNYRLAHTICFELEREQYNECQMLCRGFVGNHYKTWHAGDFHYRSRK